MDKVSSAVIQFLSSSKARVAILGLLVLTTGVFTTVYLLGQQQDIRQRASSMYYCVCQGNVYYNQNLCFELQESGSCNAPYPTFSITIAPTLAPTTSNACNTCISEGKKYSCPNLLGGYTCGNYNWGLCTECKPTATNTPVPTIPPATPTLTKAPKPTKGPTPIPTTPVLTLTPMPTIPVPTIDPACAASTGKANGCDCNINVHCASGFCELTSLNAGICANPQEPTIPQIINLTCDPNKDGVIDILDFQWWKDEAITSARTTQEADCFNPDGVVNLADFQIWKDIAVTKVRQPF